MWFAGPQSCVLLWRPDAVDHCCLFDLATVRNRPLPAHLPTTKATPAPHQHGHTHQPPLRTPLPFRSPIALPSYHPNPTHDSNAPRRGLAVERPSSWRWCEGQSRTGRWPTAEPSWLPSAAGAGHSNTVGWPSARPLGVVAQEVRMPAVPSSPCRCPRPASGVRRPVSGADSVHACLSTRPLSSVRCGRLSVQVSGVRRGRPMSVGSASAVSDRGVVGRVAVGQAAAWLGWPRSAWSPTVSTTGSSSAQVGIWRSRLAQAVLG
jgi:hypothetical protein